MSQSSNSEKQKAIAGKYHLIRRLSQSPRAQVFTARVADSEEERVLKIFNTLAMSTEQQQRMEKEIELALRVEHPYVIAAECSIDSGGIRGYAMEYARGGSLLERLKEGPLSEREVIRITAQLCAGLNALHAHGIVHRNLRPSTILFDACDDVRISNFGIVREQGAQRLTEHQAVLGAAEYVSPEYLETGMLDRRSDIYSLGTVIYEMICGQLPFNYSNPVASLQARLTEQPLSPRAITENCSEHLQSVILRALARNPFSRYESGMEMLEDLLSFSPSLDISASPCPDEAIYRSDLFVQDASFEEYDEYEHEHYVSLGAKMLDWGIEAGQTTASLAAATYSVLTSEEVKEGASQSFDFTKRISKEGYRQSKICLIQAARVSSKFRHLQVPHEALRVACLLLLGLSVSFLGYRYAGVADRMAPEVAQFITEIAADFSEPIAAHAHHPTQVQPQETEEEVESGEQVEQLSKASPTQKVLPAKKPQAPKVIRR